MQKVTKKRQEFINIFSKYGILDSLSGVKVSYAIAKNKQILEREAKAVEDTSKMRPNFKKFNDEKLELLKEMADKDDTGNPISVARGINAEFQVKERREEFNAALAELEETHKEAIKERDAQLEELEDFLNEEISLELHGIELDQIKENITVEQMNILADFLK